MTLAGGGDAAVDESLLHNGGFLTAKDVSDGKTIVQVLRGTVTGFLLRLLGATLKWASSFFEKSITKVSHLPDCASRKGSEATFSVKPPLTDGGGDSASYSASSQFGDAFFEKEVQPSIYQS